MTTIENRVRLNCITQNQTKKKTLFLGIKKFNNKVNYMEVKRADTLLYFLQGNSLSTYLFQP